jgi:hypothetical protein
MAPGKADNRSLEIRTMVRVSWRLMPFLTFAYLLCYIDRVIRFCLLANEQGSRH